MDHDPFLIEALVEVLDRWFPRPFASAVMAIGSAQALATVAAGSAGGSRGEGRRVEFEAGRECVRRAAAYLGVALGEIGAHPDGAPAWPPGMTGAITHSGGIAAAVVAVTDANPSGLTGVGLDLLPPRSLPFDRAPLFCTSSELSHLSALRDSARGSTVRLYFSCKESVQKCARERLGRAPSPHEIEIEIPAPEAGTAGRFRARVESLDDVTFDGVYSTTREHLITAVTGVRGR